MNNYYFVDDENFHKAYGDYNKTKEFTKELFQKFKNQNVKLAFINRFDSIYGSVNSVTIGDEVESPISGEYINDIIFELDTGSFGVFSDMIEGIIVK